ncbi:phosphatase PAP2 family protein [Catenovulum sp. 2E275]|uniref:phosphatase PAP2 family protein n=1 Tax=Catenovulum sp. 2E275 TaxID=2980497 RepID=UPI0021D0A9B6|nr:phosphatase PAP2 family protein [Catenovulum sp. 2E275]MCU4676679.1 phosphatase PAP2 family protein [Catenovulum sp. 2E275]
MSQNNFLKQSLLRVDVALLILSVIFFTLIAPRIDISVAGLFYDAQQGGFYLNNNPLIRAIYNAFAKPHFVILPALIVLAITFYRKYKTADREQDYKNYHKKWIYSFLLASLLIGPGLLVNEVLKNNSIGRARPVEIQEFNGPDTYTAAFEYSGQCDRNCSFVSGHASMGFYFIALGWLLRSRRAFYIGLGIGIIVGLTRIVQGGHFLSDTIFAFWVVYFTNLALGKAFKLENPLNPK